MAEPSPRSLAVFTSPSNAVRAERLYRWLDRSSDWCHVRLPPVFPEHLHVVWEDPGAGAATPGPVFVYNRTEFARKKGLGLMLAVHAPYGRFSKGSAGSAHTHKFGIGSAHKIANAIYHLQATRCIADGCHPCVHDATFAAVLEDDVQFVEGVSPGTAELFPQLLARSMRNAMRLGRNKLHLSLSHSKIVNGSEQRREQRKRCDIDWSGQYAGGGGEAMLLRCKGFTDSHSYVLTRELARKIIGAQDMLLQEGARTTRCANPWVSRTCAADPAVLDSFFEGCAAETRVDELTVCKGAVLAPRMRPCTPRTVGVRRETDCHPGQTHVTWSLFHNNSNKRWHEHRPTKGTKHVDMDAAHLLDTFPAVNRLLASSAYATWQKGLAARAGKHVASIGWRAG